MEILQRYDLIVDEDDESKLTGLNELCHQYFQLHDIKEELMSKGYTMKIGDASVGHLPNSFLIGGIRTSMSSDISDALGELSNLYEPKDCYM